MGGAEVLDLARTAIWVTIKIAAPVMLAGLAVGFIVSLFQALTQIQEQTLQYALKFFAIVFTIFITASLLGGTLYRFTDRVMTEFPALVKK